MQFLHNGEGEDRRPESRRAGEGIAERWSGEREVERNEEEQTDEGGRQGMRWRGGRGL